LARKGKNHTLHGFSLYTSPTTNANSIIKWRFCASPGTIKNSQGIFGVPKILWIFVHYRRKNRLNIAFVCYFVVYAIANAFSGDNQPKNY